MKAVVQQALVRHRLSRWDLIRFQIHTYCTLRHIQITNADLDMLVLLALTGKTELTKFCEALTQTELSTGVRIKKRSGKSKEYKFIFNSLQSARNAVAKISNLGLITKEGKGHIKIEVLPDIQLNTESNLLLTYQLLSVDPNQS